MAAFIRVCHLISVLVLLSTRFSFSSANQLLNKEGYGCTYSDDGECIHHQGAYNVPGSSVCFTCASTNVGIVIGLPGISMPGLSISLPTISIGTSGIQVGGNGGTAGYYAVCCIPVGYGYGGIIGGRPLIPVPQQGVDKDSHPIPNPHPAPPPQGSKGDNEDKHIVKPKMETRKLGRKYFIKGDENVVKATMGMGKQSNGNDRMHTLPPMSR